MFYNKCKLNLNFLPGKCLKKLGHWRVCHYVASPHLLTTYCKGFVPFLLDIAFQLLNTSVVDQVWYYGDLFAHVMHTEEQAHFIYMIDDTEVSDTVLGLGFKSQPRLVCLQFACSLCALQVLWFYPIIRDVQSGELPSLQCLFSRNAVFSLIVWYLSEVFSWYTGILEKFQMVPSQEFHANRHITKIQCHSKL